MAEFIIKMIVVILGLSGLCVVAHAFLSFLWETMEWIAELFKR